MQYPRDHTDIDTWVAQYRPQGVDPSDWAGPPHELIRTWIEELQLPGLAIAKRYTRVLARLVLWARSDGLPLDREVLLDPRVVERYSVVGLHGPAAATYRADLRRLGPQLTRKAPWEPRPTSLASRHVAHPYTDTELEDLWEAVDRQPTRLLRQAGRALFLLGAGAGLDGRWVSSVETTAIRTTNGAVVVDVAAPHPRSVPVLKPYAAELSRLVSDVAPGRLCGTTARGKNAASRLAERLHLPTGVPVFSSRRLRSTWLRLHLERGTRLPELQAAAGLEGLTVVSDLLPEVSRLSPLEYLAEVSGHDCPRAHRRRVLG